MKKVILLALLALNAISLWGWYQSNQQANAYRVTASREAKAAKHYKWKAKSNEMVMHDEAAIIRELKGIN
ncbi:hypothetical protein [Limosilactobacillus antri]|uniref:hypothetical protein n=1 Tax=Limosilactobacillus antri TaxID=227943 RepID=UPI001F55F69E|nr:hypothetical protein [Limosilactobacillus antri]